MERQSGIYSGFSDTSNYLKISSEVKLDISRNGCLIYLIQFPMSIIRLLIYLNKCNFLYKKFESVISLDRISDI